MAKVKIKKKGAGFVIEGVLNYEDQVIEVEDIGDYSFEKIFYEFNGKVVKITIDIPDVEIMEIPE